MYAFISAPKKVRGSVRCFNKIKVKITLNWSGVVWCGVCVFTRPIKGVSGRLADRVVWGGEARRGRGRGEEAEQGRQLDANI